MRNLAAGHFKHPAWGYSHCMRDYAVASELEAAYPEDRLEVVVAKREVVLPMVTEPKVTETVGYAVFCRFNGPPVLPAFVCWLEPDEYPEWSPDGEVYIQRHSISHPSYGKDTWTPLKGRRGSFREGTLGAPRTEMKGSQDEKVPRRQPSRVLQWRER